MSNAKPLTYEERDRNYEWQDSLRVVTHGSFSFKRENERVSYTRKQCRRRLHKSRKAFAKQYKEAPGTSVNIYTGK